LARVLGRLNSIRLDAPGERRKWVLVDGLSGSGYIGGDEAIGFTAYLWEIEGKLSPNYP
jgi:hypothetical protein